MKYFFLFTCICCLTVFQSSFCQSPVINKEAFLNDSSVIRATLVVNMSRCFSRSKHGESFPGRFVTTLSDGRQVDDLILCEIRGHFRQGFCYVPPLKLKFNYKDSSTLYTLKSLKLVSECKLTPDNEQFLLKEYIIYKMYNLVTNLSFHARLLNLTFQDSAGKKKPITEYAFLLEDVTDMAKRNGCKEWKGAKLNTEATNRKQMTRVALFEFMIANTDWAVSVNHNTRLVVSVKDSATRPYVVPYDFDYSGLVNTYYAVPDERLEIENVTERLYRGYPRTMPELNEILDTFKLLKNDMYALINNFNLLTPKSKQNMIYFLDGFYTVINNPVEVNRLFIEQARKE
jgi:hypothetical protein